MRPSPTRRALGALAALALASCSGSGCGAPPPSGAPDAVEADPVPAPPVGVSIDGALALGDDHGTLFLVEAVLVNETDGTLVVRSNFFSVFDGLEIVVSDRDGKVIARQHYTHHQSPATSDGAPFDLPVGETRQELGFPLERTFPPGDEVWVSLVGGLPGTDYERGLESDAVAVTIGRMP